MYSFYNYEICYSIFDKCSPSERHSCHERHRSRSDHSPAQYQREQGEHRRNHDAFRSRGPSIRAHPDPRQKGQVHPHDAVQRRQRGRQDRRGCQHHLQGPLTTPRPKRRVSAPSGAGTFLFPDYYLPSSLSYVSRTCTAPLSESYRFAIRLACSMALAYAAWSSRSVVMCSLTCASSVRIASVANVSA